MVEVKKITEKIIQEARLQAQMNIENAKREADKIIQEAQDEANKIISDGMDWVMEEAAEMKNRLISAAHMEAKKKKLQEKQNIIEETFKRTLEKIANLSNKEYQEILEKMIIQTVEKGEQELIISEKDEKRLDKDFIKNLNKQLNSKNIDGNIILSSERRETGGGFILKKEDIEINNTFPSIIRMNRPQLEEEIIKIIF